MSTNYYWLPRDGGDLGGRYVTLWNDRRVFTGGVPKDDPDCHIGKRVGAGPRGLSFTWAQRPQEVERLLHELRNQTCVVDEYGRKMTGLDMLEVLDEIDDRDYDLTHVGDEFS